MSLAATVRALVEAGATPQMILAVVEAAEASESDALAARRAKDAARQQAKRDRDNHVTSRDVTVTDECHVTPPPSLPLSPQTPLSPTHTPPDTTTRVKGPSIAKPNGFARFWEAYPNKVGKGAAEAAYAKALKLATGPDPPSDLVAAVERAKGGRQWIEGYVPNPATWLNQRRWEDEIEPPRDEKPNLRIIADAQRPDPKQLAREANYARAFAGAEIAARQRRE